MPKGKIISNVPIFVFSPIIAKSCEKDSIKKFKYLKYNKSPIPNDTPSVDKIEDLFKLPEWINRPRK